MRPTISAFIGLVVVLFSFVPCVAQMPAATLEIQMPESSSATGAPIRLNVIVKNISTEDLRIWKTSPNADGLAEAYINVEVRDPEGKSPPRIDGVPIVKNGKKYMMAKSWLTRKGVTVKPNHELHDFLLLSSLFDLRKPGTYTVSAKTDIPEPYSGPEAKWIEVASNKISFTVK